MLFQVNEHRLSRSTSAFQSHQCHSGLFPLLLPVPSTVLAVLITLKFLFLNTLSKLEPNDRMTDLLLPLCLCTPSWRPSFACAFPFRPAITGATLAPPPLITVGVGMTVATLAPPPLITEETARDATAATAGGAATAGVVAAGRSEYSSVGVRATYFF